MTDTSKYIKILAFVLIMGGIVFATVQSGEIKGLNGQTVVSFNQDNIADDLSGIATAAGGE